MMIRGQTESDPCSIRLSGLTPNFENGCTGRLTLEEIFMPDFIRDEAGNMTNDGNRKYVYDDVDRLVRVEDGNGNLMVSYTYVHVGTPAELESRTDANGVTETY